jgi:DNA-binding SARP family transcriptional activator
MTAVMLEIRVIGELEVRLAGTTAELPASRRSRALLSWLAVHPGRHSRARLAGQFWPEVLDASARASLRSALWALRSALGPGFAGYLVTERDSIALAGEGLWVDLPEVRRLLAAGDAEAAVDLCRGELLQELDDEWVLEAREELDREVAAALGELAARSGAAGDLAGAVAWARRRAALCPLDESAGAGLIRALIAAGDVPAAVEAFGRLKQRLDGELGVQVSAETAALVGAVPGRAGPAVAAAERPSQHGRPEAAAPPAGLVGRDGEFAELAAAWRTACGGAGGVVLIEGDGGIGKTRLVEELQVTAGRAGAVRLAATTAAGPGRGAPLALWTDALSDLMAVTGHPPAGLTWTADLARVVPALGVEPALGFVPALGREGRAGADPQLDRVRLCEAVVQFLGWAAGPAPVLLALEDLHLADAASLELVAYAGRRLARLPVLLVLTRRRLPSRQDLDAALGALRSRRAVAAEIRVRPLTDDAARTLVRAWAGLPDAAVDRIVGLAAGSPLIAVETARAAERDDGNLASGLGEAVRLAVSTLSGQGRVFTELVAAAGRDLDRPEVAALPLPNPARAAAEALGSGLLRADDGRIGFRHALLRDAVYFELPDPIRARLHGELAQLLRSRTRQQGQRAPGRGARRGQRAAEIARHLRLAGQDELAVSQLLMAASDARSVAAMAEASAFLSEALEIEPGDADVLVELAEVEAWRGLLEASDAAFGRALEQTSPQDTGGLISAWLKRGRWMRGGLCHPRESRRSYQNALDVLDQDPGSDPAARAEALAGLAWAEAVAGDPAVVDGLLAEADRILAGRSAGDLLTHDIGVARAHALIRAGQFTDSLGPLIAASAAAGRAGRPDMAYSCLSVAAAAAAGAGEFGRALDFADRCLPLVVPNGLLRLSVYAQVARSAILRRLARLAEARQACAAAAGYADRIGLAELDGLVRHEAGLLALASGDPGTAAAQLARALELQAPVGRPATRLRLAEALVLSGAAGRAEAELRNVALEPVTASDFPGALVARMSRVQGLVAAARGETELARRRLSESVDGWRRIARAAGGEQAGADYVAALIDLGRPPVSSLIEPGREADIASADLSALDREPAPAAARRPGNPQES